MRYIILFLLFLFSISIFSTNQEEVDYLDLLDKSIYCEQSNMRMEVYKDNKEIKFYEMEFYRLGEKMRMEFTGPATEKGRRMLNDNASLWMYLPRTSKVMKLPFKQSFMGSDASNSDLMRMTFKKDYEITSLSKKENNIIELELKAKDLEVSYNKVKITFDTKKKVPVKQEMYSLSNKLIKTLTYDNIIAVDGENIPSELTIKDELQSNSSTKLFYTNIKKKGNKSAEFFTLGSLKK